MDGPERRAITWRSVGIGALLVATICAVTPFNEYVVNNTPLVGSHLPVAVTLSMLLLVLLVNAPLHRFAPRKALTGGELSIIVMMILIACSIPTQGLMRAWLPSLVAPFHLGKSDSVFWDAFVAMGLPDWLFPVGKISAGQSSAIVSDFYGRVEPGQPIPYGAWMVPLLGWGVFIGAGLVAMGTFAWMIRTQWGENERLSLPLAQLQVALIEPPAKGRMLNSLFRSPVFWIGFTATVMLLSLNSLNQYGPRYWPTIQLYYDLTSTFSEYPLSLLNGEVKKAYIYLSFAAITFFIRSRMAFGMWSSYLILQIVTLVLATQQTELPAGGVLDQHFGASVIFAIGLFVIARKHFAMIGRHIVFGRNDDERRRDVPSYRGAGIAFVIALVVMFVWLLNVHVQPWVAGMIIGFAMLAHMVTSRVVAMTGMPVFRSPLIPMNTLTNLPVAVLTGQDVFFAGMLGINTGAFNAAQSNMSLTVHGLRVVDESNSAAHRPRGWAIAGVIIGTLLLAIGVSTYFSLRNYYTYAYTLEATNPGYENAHALEERPRSEVTTPVAQWAAAISVHDGRFPSKNWSPLTQFLIGAALCTALHLATWRLSWWPFLPVGFVVATGTFISWAWFSILLGWLAKVLVLRFGGSSLYEKAKPFCIGIIFGEAVAASIWLITSLVLVEMGLPYQTVRFLPN